MNLSTPFVDVIIAALNEEKFIASCMESLFKQNYPSASFAVHVVDNGSSDKTVALVKHYGAHVYQTYKKGAAAARNYGLLKTDGELVAFLDAHCIVNECWISSMVKHFVNENVGGCQARIEGFAVNPRIQRYFDKTGAFTNEKILEDTLSGKRNLYPWMLSGNCMYSRAALHKAGNFNEALDACEDVDLAWRVVIQGYQLEYDSTALAMHYDCNSWKGFLKKNFVYGQGAAQISRIYAHHGAKNKFAASLNFSQMNLHYWLYGIAYWFGLNSKRAKIALGLETPLPAQSLPHIMSTLRPAFSWNLSQIRISPSVIYWKRDANESVIVETGKLKRIVLNTTGHFIWSQLVDFALSHQELVSRLVEMYTITPIQAESDLNEFINELIQLGVLQLSNSHE